MILQPAWVRTDTRYIGLTMKFLFGLESHEIGERMGWKCVGFEGDNGPGEHLSFWLKPWWIAPLRNWSNLPDILLYWSALDAAEWIRVQQENKDVCLHESYAHVLAYRQALLDRNPTIENPYFRVLNLAIRRNVRGGNRKNPENDKGWEGMSYVEPVENLEEMHASILKDKSELSWKDVEDMEPLQKIARDQEILKMQIRDKGIYAVQELYLQNI